MSSNFDCKENTILSHTLPSKIVLVNSPELLSHDCLSIYYQNVRGLNTKVSLFYRSASLGEYDVIILSETWLHQNVSNDELFMSKYSVYRKDRNFAGTNTSRGGGVLIAVESSILSTLVDLDHLYPNNLIGIDLVCVKLSFPKKTLYIFGVYVPPGMQDLIYSDFVDFILSLQFVYESELLLVGDFNVPDYSSYAIASRSKNNVTSLIHLSCVLDLEQSNQVLNFQQRLLDLVLSNTICIVNRDEHPMVPEDPYHPSLSISVESFRVANKYLSPKCSASSYNFNKTNFESLLEDLSSTSWTDLSNCSYVNTACSLFYSKLNNLFDSHVPQNKLRTYKYPPWFTSEIIKNIKTKHNLHKKLKYLKNPGDHVRFKNLRRLIKNAISASYKNYVRKIESDISSDSNKFWKFIKSKKKGTHIPNNMVFNNQQVRGHAAIVNSFATLFNSVYNNSSCNKNAAHNTSDSAGTSFNIFVNSVNEDEVLETLLSLKAKHTAGPDVIPAFFIKKISSFLAEPLTILFNLSLAQGIYPDAWKVSKVIPLFKGGDRANGENYRPISIMDNFAKIFERVIFNRLFFQIKNHITQYQHGFIPGRSTITNLCAFTQFVSETVDIGRQCDAIYTDFSKAFDKLDHQLLLFKLSSLGCSPCLVKFLKSYLCNRKQFIFLHGYSSDYFNPTSGVPQGSVLGPLLFNVFINDIVNCLSVDCLLYADDLKLFSVISSFEDCARLQKNVSEVENWCLVNDLQLNVNKCSVMTYGRKKKPILFRYKINNVTLQRPDTVKDLGVLFDPEMTFNPNINMIVNSAMKLYGFIARNSKDFTKSSTIISIYISYVRTKLEYGAIVWFPYHAGAIASLERVQRRFLKYACFRENGVYPERGVLQSLLLQKFSISSLEHRFKIQCIIFLQKLISAEYDCSDILSKICFYFNSRSANARYEKCVFYLPTPRTDVLKHSPLYNICHYGNAAHLKIDIFKCTKKAIKSIQMDDI